MNDFPQRPASEPSEPFLNRSFQTKNLLFQISVIVPAVIM